MPKVSVIVPNYNHAPFLTRRLDSIFDQTFQDFEVILLDDCSSDDSLGILQQYGSDPRVQIHVNEKNSGSPFKQWNKGLDFARGEYIWIAESDDYADELLLEHLVGALEANPNAGIAYCQSWLVPPVHTDVPLTVVKGWYEDFDDSERWQSGFSNKGQDELSGYMVFKNTIPNASAVVFRHSVLGGELRASENMHLAGDWQFWVNLLLRSDIVFDAKPLNYFRIPHTGSQRDSTEKQGLELLEGLQIYTLINKNLSLEARTRQRALRHHVRLWGTFANVLRYSRDLNKHIYATLVEAHPEIGGQRFRRIIVPFSYYFAAVPFRRVHFLRVVVRGLRRAVYWLLGKPVRSVSP